MSRTKGIYNVVPERLSERTIEVNFIRRLAHCLEECRRLKRDDIVPLSPTQNEEDKKGYDTLVDGLCVALQFKRPCRMDDDRAKFEIDTRQARRLKEVFPPGAAFYVLPPVGDLNELVEALPKMMDTTYIVDVHKLFPKGAPCNKHSCTLWIDRCGRITVHDMRFQNGSHGTRQPLLRPAPARRRSYSRTLGALCASVLCYKARSDREKIGFSLNKDGSIMHMVPGPEPESIRWKRWEPTTQHPAGEPIEPHYASAAILHAAKAARLALVCMGAADKPGALGPP